MSSSPLFGFDLGELRHVDRNELLARFAFGAGISVAAGLGGQLIGKVVGGLLLAFPAVLPASVTLVEQRDGTDAAVHDVGGAVFGALGLVAFAALAQELFRVVSAPLTLLAALAAWTVVSLSLYVLRATGVLPTAAPLAGERELRWARRRVGDVAAATEGKSSPRRRRAG